MSTSEVIIKKQHFKRFHTCQPFFVWNSLKNGFEIEDEDLLIDLIWDEEQVHEKIASYGARFVKTFSLIDEHLISILKSQSKLIIIKGLTLDERLAQTQAALNEQAIIINPVFKSMSAVASPFAFDTTKQAIINLKYTSKTDRLDILDGYFDYQVISNHLQPRDYELWLISDKDAHYWKKDEINLKCIKCVNPGKTKQFPKQTHPLFIEIFRAGGFDDERSKNFVQLSDFEQTLQAIHEAKSLKEPDASLIWKDATFWGTNKEWDLLLKAIKSPFVNYSGKLFTKQHIIDSPFELPFHQSALGKVLANMKQPLISANKLKALPKIRAAKIVVWYDFEGFSLPFSPLDYVRPYQQIVFQVSVFRTEDQRVVSFENLVLDPQEINQDAFVKIIRTIYQADCEAYVVYNRAYEITRLKEMLTILNHNNHEASQEFEQMLQAIEQATVDLYDDFKITSANRIPAILLHDQKGKASIKNVENHITNLGVNLEHKIKPYKSLEIKNGAMAMEVGIDRYLGIIGNKEWQKTREQLAIYCQNDVQAMLMVYEYLSFLQKDLEEEC